MKSKILLIFLFFLFVFEYSVLTRVFFPYIIFLNVLIIIASALLTDSVYRRISLKFSLLKKNKKKARIYLNVLLICSSIILLVLTSIDAIRNENALNKIRTMEIRAEIIIPTEIGPVGESINLGGVGNALYFYSSDDILYQFVSDNPIISSQVATTTRKLYITYRPRPDRLYEIYGKQVEVLENIKKMGFNFNNLVHMKKVKSTPKVKLSFYLNGILTNILHFDLDNVNYEESTKNKIFLLDALKTFKNIETRYDNIQKSKILK